MSKPSNWESLTKQQQKDHAYQLCNSERGMLIIGQALAIAEAALRDKRPHPELSNADDMAMLGETMFTAYNYYRKHASSAK